MANALSLRYYGGAGPAWAEFAAGDKLYFQGAAGALSYGAAGAIAVNGYNAATHVISSANADVCLTNHQPNLAYGSTAAKVSINGAAEIDIDATHPDDLECLNLHGTADPNAEITASSVFVYKTGEAETVVPDNCSIYALKYGATANWASIAGSAAALSLGTVVSGATHDMFFGITIKPTDNGALTGTIKCSATFV